MDDNYNVLQWGFVAFLVADIALGAYVLIKNFKQEEQERINGTRHPMQRT